MRNSNALMGSGLQSTYRDGLLSPRSVIDSARNSVRNDHMSQTLSVIGGRKPGWENPHSNAMNNKGNRGELTIQDIVDGVIKKPAFGFQPYDPKPVVKDLIKVHTHVKQKAKRRMFCEEASRAKDKIPASSKYFSAIDWNKSPETRTIKFLSNPRRTIADEIMHKSKNPAKTSPGPAGYGAEAAWRKTLPQFKGSFKNLENRTTFVQESGWKAAQSPGYVHQDIKLVSYYSASVLILKLTVMILSCRPFTKRKALHART